MKRKLTLNVSAQEAFAIQKFCERKGLAPLAVLLNACGHQNPESLLFDIEPLVEKRLLPTKIDDPRLTDPAVRLSKKLELKRQLSEEAIWSEIDNRQPLPRRRGGQNEVYLGLLSQLLKWDEKRVSVKLENKRGAKRLLFSRNRNEVEQPKLIPDSRPEWYACTKLPAGQKKQILFDLLKDLGFTYAYSCLISELVDNRRPPIAGLHFVSGEASGS